MKRTRHCSEVLPLVLSLLVACRKNADHPPADTLVVAIESGPLHLDPRSGTDQNSWRVHHVVFNGLVKNGKPGEYLPDVAESFTTADARVWKFRLRDGVTFHDGRRLTSRDVVYTFQSLLAPGFASGKKQGLSIVREIQAPTPRDVEFHLKTPYASFPLQLLIGIVPEGTSAQEADSKPIGTGPFRLVSYTPDDRVVFERFDGHFAGKAKVARLVYRIIPDATTRALELLRGSLHLTINSLPPDLLPRFREAPNLRVTVGPGSTYFYLAFNFRDPILRKPEVRRALALALDREALAHGLWRDTVELTETLLPPGHWARSADLPPVRRDLSEAKRLLDEAGFPDRGDGKPRLTLTYKTSTDETTILQATAIKEQWRAIGVETAIRSNDFAVFYEDVVKGNFQLFSLRWQGIVDPDHYHEVFLSSATPPKGWNRGFFSDPEMDRWIDEARTLSPIELRRPLYERIQRRASESLPYVSLFTSKNVTVHSADLTGLETIPPTGDFTFLREIGRH